jgi:hypothetical protein
MDLPPCGRSDSRSIGPASLISPSPVNTTCILPSTRYDAKNTTSMWRRQDDYASMWSVSPDVGTLYQRFLGDEELEASGHIGAKNDLLHPRYCIFTEATCDEFKSKVRSRNRNLMVFTLLGGPWWRFSKPRCFCHAEHYEQDPRHEGWLQHCGLFADTTAEQLKEV